MKEVWRDVIEYKNLYQVSNLGRVKSLERKVKTFRGFKVIRERLLKQSIGSHGYKVVGLSKDGKTKTKLVHKLVAESFLRRNKKLKVINHIDGDKTNNTLSNLERSNHSLNAHHAIELGLTPTGDKRSYSKLTINQVAEIKKLLKEGVSAPEICKRFPINRGNVYKIRDNKIWKMV